jgi:trans-2,3-dihydro-3-hydroxyanthranilate isomerase
MPTFPYHVVDVFTDRPFAGNPLAVVLDADDLPTEAMQTIAREFNLSETTFPMQSAVADYRLRIFTPIRELAFAGHPSVGTAWLLAQQRRIQVGEVRQECGVGVLPIEVTDTGATLTGGPTSHGEPLDPAPLLSLFGLDRAAADGPPPRAASSGTSFLYLPVPPDVIGRLGVPEQAALQRLTAEAGVNGIVAFVWDPRQLRSHARVFVPGIGEDPATGSAAVGFGVYLAASNLVDPDGTTAYRIDQGSEILRPSALSCTVSCTAGTVVRTTVAGQVQRVAAGELIRPPSV